MQCSPVDDVYFSESNAFHDIIGDNITIDGKGYGATCERDQGLSVSAASGDEDAHEIVQWFGPFYSAVKCRELVPNAWQSTEIPDWKFTSMATLFKIVDDKKKQGI